MFRGTFLSSALVLMVGVNLGAWALSVGTSTPSGISVTVPISSQALRAEALSASAAVPIENTLQLSPDNTTYAPEDVVPTSTADSTTTLTKRIKVAASTTPQVITVEN